MTKPVIQFKHVQKQFGKNVVIPDLSFEINQGEFVTILGSSGSGKTTTLKMVNGLWKPNAGEILIDGQKISDLDLVQLRRHMGYVVQQIGLFPHMTIAENIAVVPKMLQWEQSKIDQRVKELLALVQLDPAKYANRYPSQLSGVANCSIRPSCIIITLWPRKNASLISWVTNIKILFASDS